MNLSAKQLAEQLQCECVGDSEVDLQSVASLEKATPGQLSFYTGENKRFLKALGNTQASVVILSPKHQHLCQTNMLLANNPYATYAKAAALLHPPRAVTPGVSVRAVVADDVHVPESVHVADNAVVETGVTLGERVMIGPGCVVKAGVHLNDDVMLVANVTVLAASKIGKRTIIHPGAVVGSDGFSNAQTDEGWLKLPQLGSVRIGDDVEVGANTTIDRGLIDDTLIDNGARLDNQIQIAHNCHIGEHTAIAACVGMAGSTRIGKRCMIAGDAGFTGHLDVADDVVVLGRSLVTQSINEPGVYMGSFPADEVKTWRRNVARFRQLDKMAKRLQACEKTIAELTRENDE